MSKWRIIGIIGASKSLGTVEADTKEEALEKAIEELENEMHISLCWQCSGEIDIGDINELEAYEVE